MSIDTYIHPSSVEMEPSSEGTWVKLEDHEMAMEAKQISWDILYHSYKEMKANAKAFGWRERDDGSDE